MLLINKQFNRLLNNNQLNTHTDHDFAFIYSCEKRHLETSKMSFIN